jgi:hypothetical protein
MAAPGGRRATEKRSDRSRQKAAPPAQPPGLGNPDRWTPAELFFCDEREKYVGDADGLKQLQKKAAQQGLDLEKESESFREELRAYVGAKPYSRRKSYANKLTFLARRVVVGGEEVDVLIPADFLTDPENDFELRKYVERLTGDPALVWKWYRQAEKVRNIRRRFRRALRGAADQGRPKGQKDSRPRVPREPNPDRENARVDQLIALWISQGHARRGLLKAARAQVEIETGKGYEALKKRRQRESRKARAARAG